MIIEIQREPRSCDACDAAQATEIWSYCEEARTVTHTFRWQVRNVVCDRCGFAFVSPVPTQEALAQYYSDSFSTFEGQPLDYSVEKRLALLRRFVGSGARRYLEVGANHSPEFERRLGEWFETLHSVELNASVEATHRSLAEVEPGFADVVAAYFVLEHIPNPVAMLRSCREALTSEGILIVEVPDRSFYPRDVSGLILYEHTNHFAPRSFGRIAERAGLEMIAVSHAECSRPFGFAAVLRKAEPREEGAAADALEYLDAVSSLSAGRELIAGYHRDIEEARNRIAEAADGGVVIWAANDVCQALLKGFGLPEGAVIVDSDPRKSDWLSPLPVHQPREVLDHLRQAKLFVMCSSRNSGVIQEWLAQETGRRLQGNEVIALGFPTG